MEQNLNVKEISLNAKKLYDLKDYKGAKKEYLNIINKCCGAYGDIGNCEYRLKNYSSALGYYENQNYPVQKRGNSIPKRISCIGNGKLYSKLIELKKEINEQIPSLTLDVKNYVNALISLYIESDNLSAIAHLKNISSNSLPEARQGHQKLVEEKNGIDKEVKYILEAIESDDTDVDNFITIAELYSEHRKYKEYKTKSIYYYEKALELDNTSAYLFKQCADLYLENKEYDKAINCLTRTLTQCFIQENEEKEIQGIKKEDIYISLGNIYLEQAENSNSNFNQQIKYYSLAIENFELALQFRPQETVLYYQIAKAYHELQYYKKAGDYYYKYSMRTKGNESHVNSRIIECQKQTKRQTSIDNELEAKLIQQSNLLSENRNENQFNILPLTSYPNHSVNQFKTSISTNQFIHGNYLIDGNSMYKKITNEDFKYYVDTISKCGYSGFNHINIVKYSSFENDFLKMDYCKDGNLYDYIHNNDDYKQLTLIDKLKIIQQIVKGLIYLESKEIYPCKLNPYNIFIEKKDSEVIVKVGDYINTLKKIKYYNWSFPFQEKPEEMKKNYLPYSLGIIIGEIFTGEEPYKGLNNEDNYRDIGLNLSCNFRFSRKFDEGVSKVAVRLFFSLTNKDIYVDDKDIISYNVIDELGQKDIDEQGKYMSTSTYIPGEMIENYSKENFFLSKSNNEEDSSMSIFKIIQPLEVDKDKFVQDIEALNLEHKCDNLLKYLGCYAPKGSTDNWEGYFETASVSGAQVLSNNYRSFLTFRQKVRIMRDIARGMQYMKDYKLAFSLIHPIYVFPKTLINGNSEEMKIKIMNYHFKKEIVDRVYLYKNNEITKIKMSLFDNMIYITLGIAHDGDTKKVREAFDTSNGYGSFKEDVIKNTLPNFEHLLVIGRNIEMCRQKQDEDITFSDIFETE